VEPLGIDIELARLFAAADRMKTVDSMTSVFIEID